MHEKAAASRPNWTRKGSPAIALNRCIVLFESRIRPYGSGTIIEPRHNLFTGVKLAFD
jgi:hypothetical protein